MGQAQSSLQDPLGKGRRSPIIRIEVLQHFGMLIAFGLLLGATDFIAEHLGLAAVLIFLFSLPYLVASIAGKRAGFLYGAMLFGAVAYFLACNALGAPNTWFPLLSVPLVLALWVVGDRLRRSAGPLYAAFPVVVFRAMHITVGVFAGWAVVQFPRVVGDAGTIRYVAGATFIAYGFIYLAHLLSGSHVLFAYVFSGFLAAGGVLAGVAVPWFHAPWIGALAASAIISVVGTSQHKARTYLWSRHVYLCLGGALFVGLAASVLQLSSVLLCLPLAAGLLWLAYGRLSRSVGSVRLATTAERFVGRCLFLGVIGLSIPLVPFVFVMPARAAVAHSAMLFGLLYILIARSRRAESTGGRLIYILPAALFITAGLGVLGGHLPDQVARIWALVCPLALLAAAGVLHRMLLPAGEELSHVRRGIAEAAVFPAFFAWYLLVLRMEPMMALAGAGAALAISLAMSPLLRERLFLYAVGPAVGGIIVAGSLLPAGHSLVAWTTCAAAAAAAGVCFTLSWRTLTVARGIAGLAWLVLSVAAFAIAANCSAAQALYAATAVGFISVLMAGQFNGPRRDILDHFVNVVSVLATIAAFVLGPLSRLDPFTAGLCLLVLSVAYYAAWFSSRSPRFAISGDAMFSLGALLIVFSKLPSAEGRLACGSVVVLVLFMLASTARSRFPVVSKGSVLVGHITGIVLAGAALIQAWQGSSGFLALAALPYVAIYAASPRLRGRLGFRIGIMTWSSIAALFALAALRNTPYREQVPQVALLSVAWLVLGFAVRNTRMRDFTAPGYVCAVLLAILCGAVTLFAPAEEGTWGVFLVNCVVFTALYVILRQDIFVYLVTLVLSLMAFDWVKASTSEFTQDVLFYLVIGLSILGVFFLLPHIKRLLDRIGMVPVFSIFTWQGALAGAVPVACISVLLLSAYSLKITHHPKFCTSCHYMGDYYTSWQHSSHKDVACVECHYEPGVRAEVEGKLKGVVQLVNYLGHSYDTKPHALISNESCMRSDCHDDMDHSEEVLLFHGSIRFRHDTHLSAQPRGKVLNCVSCHGQTIQGQHISVTETTCTTCHFYGRGSRPIAVGDCRSCHILPDKPVNFAGEPFSHKSFLSGRDKVECVHCHSHVTQGEGAISAARCKTCHLSEELQKGGLADQIKDQAEFHLVHVSKGHFDCLQCHDEIKHGIHPMAEQLLTSGECDRCHGGKRHSIQEAIYSGTAVRELDDMPDLMYMAGVACDGCHTDTRIVKAGEFTLTSKRAGAKACVDCHADESYDELLVAWQDETSSTMAEVKKTLAELQSMSRAPEVDANEQASEAFDLLASAQSKLSKVELDGSLGAHNIQYVSEILSQAQKNLRRCRSLLAAKEQ